MDNQQCETPYTRCKYIYEGLQCDVTWPSGYVTNDEGFCDYCAYSNDYLSLKSISLRSLGRMDRVDLLKLVENQFIPQSIRDDISNLVPCAWCRKSFHRCDDYAPNYMTLNAYVYRALIPICRSCKDKAKGRCDLCDEWCVSNYHRRRNLRDFDDFSYDMICSFCDDEMCIACGEASEHGVKRPLCDSCDWLFYKSCNLLYCEHCDESSD